MVKNELVVVSRGDPPGRPYRVASRTEIFRIAILGASVVAISILHQATSPHLKQFQDIYQFLPYVPIVLGAFWYGLRGGLACSLLTSACFAIHLFLQEGGHPLGHGLPRTLNIVLFNVVGLAMGYLSQLQKNESARYRWIAGELDKSSRELKERTEALFQAERELQKALRLSALGELSASLAHEIRNPLGSIRGAGQIIADSSTPDQKRSEFARLLVNDVDRLDGVLHTILDFARPSEPEPGPTDMSRLLASVLEMCAEELKSRRILVEVKSRPCPLLPVDAGKMHQVFLNLVLNASQAMPKGGRLRINTAAIADEARFSVEDTGVGMAARDLEHLFEPFFTTKPGGTGLGLAIAHRIVTSFGGKIEVQSRPGAGSTFTVILPIRGDEPLGTENHSSRG